jgi:uncharacterized protein (DUF4415 family)
MTTSHDFSNGERGPVIPPESGKTRVTIRLDDEVIDWFRQQVNEAGGGSYQTLINAALQKYIAEAKASGTNPEVGDQP